MLCMDCLRRRKQEQIQRQSGTHGPAHRRHIGGHQTQGSSDGHHKTAGGRPDRKLPKHLRSQSVWL